MTIIELGNIRNSYLDVVKVRIWRLRANWTYIHARMRLLKASEDNKTTLESHMVLENLTKRIQIYNIR